MQRLTLAAILVAVSIFPVAAQTTWAPWYQPSLLDRNEGRSSVAQPPPVVTKKKATTKARPIANVAGLPSPAQVVRAPVGVPAGLSDADDDYDGPPKPAAPIVVSGGPRPDITPRSPSSVTYSSGQSPGTIVIDSAARKLFLVTSASTALAYPVSVGREGFAWNGSEKISRVAEWPDWHPPAEMRERDPKLPNKMLGGVKNPLGAKALYLGNTLYRIHGTSDARSVGRAASSGCFRMHNGHIVDLAQRVGVGTKVVVKNAPYSSTVQAAAARAAAPPATPAPRSASRPQ